MVWQSCAAGLVGGSRYGQVFWPRGRYSVPTYLHAQRLACTDPLMGGLLACIESGKLPSIGREGLWEKSLSDNRASWKATRKQSFRVANERSDSVSTQHDFLGIFCASFIDGLGCRNQEVV